MSQRKQRYDGEDANANDMLSTTADETECQLASFRPSAFTNGGGDHSTAMKCKDVTLPKGIASFTMTNGSKNITGLSKNRVASNTETMWDELPGHTDGVELDLNTVVLLSKQSCDASVKHQDNRNGFSSTFTDATPADAAQDSCIKPDEGLFTLPLDVTELAKRQQQIDRRVSHFIKRLRRLQALEGGKLASQQLTRFVDDHHKCLEQVARHIKGSSVSNEPLNAEVLQSEDIKSLSTAALVSLVQRLQMTQGIVANRTHMTNSSIAMDKDEKADVNAVSSVIHMNLRHIERCIDSDATDSSSGGESDSDVHQTSADKTSNQTKYPGLLRWAENRAAVACRWTWLQAQVADLEFQIRQCSDYIKRSRSAKEVSQQLQPHTTGGGGVGLGPCSWSGQDGTTVEQRCPTISSYGVHVPHRDDTGCKGDGLPGGNEAESAARCKPTYCPLSRHKVLRLSATNCRVPEVPQWHHSSLCQCDEVSAQHCMLCCASFNQTPTGECARVPKKERRALMDPCYHPVLSFPRDTSMAAKCDAVLRKEDWARKLSTNKCVKRNFKKKECISSDPGSPLRKKLKTTVSSLILSRNKECISRVHPLPGKQHGFSSTSRVCKSTGRRKRRRALEVLAKRGRAHSSSHARQAQNSTVLCADFSASLTQSAPASVFRDARVVSRRRGESAFDINNIVIPYQMASLTRPERLQYKEILTPKWREIEANTTDKTHPAEDEETEDISDEAMLVRHTRMESQEKKRYTVFKTTARRSRQQSLRGDSDPSTPEPWSPEGSFIDASSSSLLQPLGVASPGASLSVDDGLPLDESTMRPRSESVSQQRCVSDGLLNQSRLGQCTRTRSETTEESLTSATLEEVVQLIPWAKRNFPLSDEDERLLHAGDSCCIQPSTSCSHKNTENVTQSASPVDQSSKWTAIPVENDVAEQENELKLA